MLSTLGPLRAGKCRLGFEGRWGLRAVLRCCPRRAPCSGRHVRARAPASRRGLRPLPVRARRARGSSRGRPVPPRSSPRKQRPDSAGRAAGSPRADAAVPHVLGFFTPNPLPSPRDRPLLAVNGVGSFVSGGPWPTSAPRLNALRGNMSSSTETVSAPPTNWTPFPLNRALATHLRVTEKLAQFSLLRGHGGGVAPTRGLSRRGPRTVPTALGRRRRRFTAGAAGSAPRLRPARALPSQFGRKMRAT